MSSENGEKPDSGMGRTSDRKSGTMAGPPVGLCYVALEWKQGVNMIPRQKSVEAMLHDPDGGRR